jgi:uracil-DNA glycosylase
MLSVKSYAYKSWAQQFPDNNVSINDSPLHYSWTEFFDKEIKTDPRYSKIDKLLSKCLENGKEVFPYPEMVFNAFNHTHYNDVTTIIIGQDPFFNKQTVDTISYPEAMGISFSVPKGIPIPSSLKNIYKNAVKYKRMNKYPDHGNLQTWAYQGCLMINAALTVQEGCKNSHEKVWSWITDKLIKHLSDTKDHLVFVLWGSFAYSKLDLIDQGKHKVIASSHPSGLSYMNTMGSNPAFMNQDHFGLINKYLKEFGKDEIMWQI